MYGEYHKLGPRKTIGFWATIKELFGWRDCWEDDNFSYHENMVTGDRKAIPRNGITARNAVPDHKWLDAVR
jgi:hypothetical protein